MKIFRLTTAGAFAAVLCLLSAALAQEEAGKVVPPQDGKPQVVVDRPNAVDQDVPNKADQDQSKKAPGKPLPQVPPVPHKQDDDHTRRMNALGPLTKATLEFETKRKDFGSVIEGGDQYYDFHFEVKGEGDLQIKSVRPSCGCTVAKIDVDGKPYKFDDPIPVGAKGFLRLSLRTRGYRGVKSSLIDVYSNGANGRLQLSVTANIQQFFQLSPAYANFGMVTGGSRPRQEIEVWSTQVPAFEITEWGEAAMPRVVPRDKKGQPTISTEEMHQWMEEDMMKIQDPPAGLEYEQTKLSPSRYKLSFTLVDTKTEGVYAKRLRFVTDQKRTFEFTVHAVIQPLVSLDPPTHYPFGLVKRNTSVTGQFKLINGDKTRDVAIKGVELENCPQSSHLQVMYYEDEDPKNPGKKAWFVRIVVLETMPAGAFRGALKIFTDHPDFKERRGYFTGYVR